MQNEDVGDTPHRYLMNRIKFHGCLLADGKYDSQDFAAVTWPMQIAGTVTNRPRKDLLLV